MTRETVRDFPHYIFAKCLFFLPALLLILDLICKVPFATTGGKI